VVFSGQGAATLMAYPVETLRNAFAVARNAYGTKPQTPEEVARTLLDLSVRSRVDGVLSLVGMEEMSRDTFLSGAVQCLVDNYKEDEIRDLLGAEMHFFALRRQQSERVFQTLARLGPAFGLAGSVIGIIGMIMGMGILILFLGNSLIDTALSGLQRMFVEGYTGDLMVTGPTEFPTTVLGETAGSEEVLPHIAQIKKYEDFLASRKDVAATLPLLSGQVSFGIGETELGSGYCFGVNVEDYRTFFPDNVTLVDADTMRDLLGFASLRDGAPVLSAREAAFVAGFDPNSLFNDLFAGSGGTTASGAAQVSQSPDTGGSGGSSAQTSAQTSVVADVVPAWQFLLVRVKPGASASRLLSDLSAFSTKLGDGDRVQDWVAGAGKVARTAVTIRLAFDLLVAVVAVVVVMIMMNVLIISVNERLYEIGTLRAIGAKRRVVRRMILYETAFLALIAGAAGLLVGFILLLVLGRVGIRAPNLFFEALFGGQVLKPMVSGGAALRAFLWILAMGLGASWYPTVVALRIEPVIAMRGD
jgi:ABC-type lipoprotein release transport system permease subunit